MPSADHKDYMRRYHARTRPAPTPQPQPRGDLPPRGALLHSDDGTQVQCHVCGRWLGALVTHVVKGHGLPLDEYRQLYGLARTLPLVSRQWQERQGQRALERDQGSVGREAIAEIGPHPRPAGIENRLSSRVRRSQAGRGY